MHEDLAHLFQALEVKMVSVNNLNTPHSNYVLACLFLKIHFIHPGPCCLAQVRHIREATNQLMYLFHLSPSSSNPSLLLSQKIN